MPTGKPARHLRKLILIGICALILLSALSAMRPTWQHDAPRDLPWQVADFGKAHFSHQTLPNGQIQLEIDHLPLQSITPEMLAWWYRVLPISTIEINGTTHPLYHIFHLTEHGQLWVVEAANDGSPGMGEGSLVARREWFGPHDSEGAGRVISISAQGLIVRPEVAGVQMGEIRHLFNATTTGSHYRVESLIGVEWPVVGPAFNYLLRHTVFTEDMLREWERHQVEEVSMLNYYLPQLYAQRAGDYHFELEVNQELTGLKSGSNRQHLAASTQYFR
jgi:hypothetical protein